MKTSNNKTENLRETTNLSFQVVLKLCNNVSTPRGNQAGISDDVIPWTQFKMKVPEIKIGRLFTSLSADEIVALVEAAKSSDKLYRPPNFLGYYVISCRTEIDAQAVLQSLLTNENVE